MKIKSFEQIQIEKEEKKKSKQVMEAIKKMLNEPLPLRGYNLDSMIRDVVSSRIS